MSKQLQQYLYGVASISRLLKIIGLFCRIQSLLQGSFAKETCNFNEPTNRSHPITELRGWVVWCVCIEYTLDFGYGVTTISRLLNTIGLFFRIQSLLYGSFAKETYNFKDPTNRSHPIVLCVCIRKGIHVHVCMCTKINKYIYIYIYIYNFTYLYTCCQNKGLGSIVCVYSNRHTCGCVCQCEIREFGQI